MYLQSVCRPYSGALLLRQRSRKSVLLLAFWKDSLAPGVDVGARYALISLDVLLRRAKVALEGVSNINVGLVRYVFDMLSEIFARIGK
jgi:hypothetical protein